jgi:hypothetical protein
VAALEGRELLSTIVVDNPTDTPVTGETDLRQAVAQANSNGGAETIDFASIVFNKPQTITLSSGPLTLTDPAGISIQGPDDDPLTISGGGKNRVFYIDGGKAALSTLTISNGSAWNGGGLDNTGGTLTLTLCTVTGNTANNAGGGLYTNSGGKTYLYNSAVDHNTASSGGGLFATGTLKLKYCFVSGNTATNRGGGLYNSDGGMLTLEYCQVDDGNTAKYGGGLDNNFATTTLNDSEVQNNTAGVCGGGLHTKGGTLTLTNNCTVSGNHANDDGGGLYASYYNAKTYLAFCKVRLIPVELRYADKVAPT